MSNKVRQNIQACKKRCFTGENSAKLLDITDRVLSKSIPTSSRYQFTTREERSKITWVSEAEPVSN